MDRLDCNTRERKGKHLNYEERLKIEALSKAGLRSEEIGRQLGGRSGRTIRRELKQGRVELLIQDEKQIGSMRCKDPRQIRAQNREQTIPRAVQNDNM